MNLAEAAQGSRDPSSLNVGKRYWQRTLLVVTMLQLKLRARTSGTSAAMLWLDQTLQCIGHTQLAPQTVARMLTIVQTCGYDAWSAYDPIALGSRLGGSLRRPRAEQ